MAEDRGFEPL